MISIKDICLLLVCICLICPRLCEPEPTCGHSKVKQNPGLLNIQEDTSPQRKGRVLESSRFPHIRIYPYYNFLRQSAPSSFVAYLQNELAPAVIDYFQGALRVKYPVIGNLVVGDSVDVICDKKTPSILMNAGVDADFFIYFDAERQEGSTVATSHYCYLAAETKRPLVGATIFNLNMISEAKGDPLKHERNTYLLLHEMMHTLGFSEYSFPYFIDEYGNTRTDHIKTVKLDGMTTTVIDVPPLTDKLRRFFGCQSMPGAYLENNGGSGTADGHFERKIFVFETMSSGSISGRKVSEFSLALLEGSGWYIPDYNYAEPYFFGQGEGCGFLSGSCTSRSYNFNKEWCKEELQIGCAPYGRGGGFCQSDPKSDQCQYYYPVDDYDCDNPDGVDFVRLPELQVFGRGAGSKCFTGTLNTRQSSDGRATFCFKYSCFGSGENTELQVQVGNDQVVCKRAGPLAIDGFYGWVDCPDPLTFCSTVGVKYCPRNCMGRGNCVNNKCQCYLGYKGIDCGMNA